MTRDKSNRKIAEALVNHKYHTGGGSPFDCDCPELEMDFYLSEEANALVLEAMPRCELRFHTATRYVTGECGLKSAAHWTCRPDFQNQPNIFASDPDRKTAICSAFLALLEEK